MSKKPFFKIIVALGLPLLAVVPAHAFEYKLGTTLSSQQKMAVLSILKEADQTLPETMKAALDTVEVRFNRLSDKNGKPIIGVANPRFRTLTLDNGTLAEIIKGPQASTKTTRTHGNMYKEILATILHETTHLYDLANVHSDVEKDWINRCDTKFVKSKEERIQNGPRPYACKYYQNMTTSFSGNPYFLQVAGWTGQSESGLNQRSPDQYELENSKEHLAVNMEYFLLDPEFKCRRPTMYKVMSAQFRHIPFKEVNCEPQLGYVVPNISGKMAELKTIDPDRVYQVHYLFAEKGSDLTSGWGHAMIRLVMCSPERKFVGPDCLRDVDHHLVLSYRAFVESVQLSAWKGMIGDYPSRLFILPLNQVVDEYAKDQFRALRSLPLAFTRQQIRDFVTRSVEIHWSYNGKYKFITNNCATETLDLLQSVLLSPVMMNTEIKTPKGLYQALLKQGLGNERVFFDQSKALELGYYFDSYLGRFEKTFGIIKDAGLTNVKDFQEWLNAGAGYREKVVASVNTSLPNYKRITAAMFLLEMAAQRQLQIYIMSELANMTSTSNSGAGSSGKTVGDDFLTLSQIFAKPSSFLEAGKGYGLPSAVETAKATAIIAKKEEQARVISEHIKKMAETMPSADVLKEVESSNNIIKELQKLLRAK